VATVDANGKVTGVSVGATTITVKGGGLTTNVPVTILSSGNYRTFNVQAETGLECDQAVYHGARVVATSAHAVFYEDVNNPAGGFTQAEYQSLIDKFENVTWATDVTNFGTPSDIDGNGKVFVLFTRAVNELTPVGASYIVGGFFYGRDLYPHVETPELQACAGSNLAEMFYMLIPDPSGTINGHQRPKDYVLRTTPGTLAHEFQHAINFGRRVFVNHTPLDEALFLDEGLSHVAEELNFYAASGLAPRQNLTLNGNILTIQARVDAFNNYQLQNAFRYQTYLEAPATNSPWADNDDVETRGATWDFLRYLADRRNGNDQTFWFALVNSQTKGMANIQAVLGSDPVPFARDWAVSVYADDAVPVAAQFTQPSWNFREIMTNSVFSPGFDLNVPALTSGTTTVSITSGSAAYRKLGVAPAQQADLRVIQNTGTVPGTCTPLNLAVGGVQQISLGSGVALCLPGGATGSEYVVIPFHGNVDQDTTVTVQLTASNVIPPLGPPNPNRLPTARATLFRLDGASLDRPWDGGFERRLREASHRLMLTHVKRMRGAPQLDVVSGAGVSTIWLNVVRTK